MNDLKITATVTQSNGKRKPFEESYKESSLPSQIDAMRRMQTSINDYLTQLVSDEKAQINATSSKGDARRNASKVDENEESDIELEEDYIDAEIKKKLSVGQDSSSSVESVNDNHKRTRSGMRNVKKSR